MKPIRILTATAAAVLAGTVIAAADGAAVYKTNCAACHDNMDPKLGDKAAWAPLIKRGDDALTASTIKGTKIMPPRGGNPALSDGDIRAAVEFMVSKSH